MAEIADTGQKLPNGKNGHLYSEHGTISIHLTGRCYFSKNPSENTIRPFIIGYKGRLFSDTQVGTETSAIIYTIVENVKANEVNVFHYLKLLPEKQLNDRMPDKKMEHIAPWNPEVKVFLDIRTAKEHKNQ